MTNYKVPYVLFAVALTIIVAAPLASARQHKAKLPKSLRLYVFDCGVLHFDNADSYSLKKEEVAATDMSVPCFLVAHPKGTMIWDTGIIPDISFKPGGGLVKEGIATSDTPLLPQLAAAGYLPADITYLALSHNHGDLPRQPLSLYRPYEARKQALVVPTRTT